MLASIIGVNISVGERAKVGLAAWATGAVITDSTFGAADTDVIVINFGVGLEMELLQDSDTITSTVNISNDMVKRYFLYVFMRDSPLSTRLCSTDGQKRTRSTTVVPDDRYSFKLLWGNPHRKTCQMKR